jgi:ribosomal-protein-alanine N-acetyltransferase
MLGVDEVHLLNITVAPAQRHRGLGLALLDELCRWSRSQGAQWLWLEVRQSNQRALQIYERYGFRRVGERRDYYPLSLGRRETAVVMSHRLQG